MRIVCPECEAAYSVPDALIEPGKRVRCARCNAEWAPVPARDQEAAPVLRARAFLEPAVTEKRSDAPRELPPAPTVPAHGSLRVTSGPTRRPAPTPRPPAGDRPVTAARLGWALTLVVLIVLAAAAVNWRDAVMAGWPASARVYSALGLNTPAPPR